MAAQFLAAAAQALPALMGGSGGSTDISVSNSNTMSSAINPAISVSLGGGVAAFPTGNPYSNAPTTAYTAETDPAGTIGAYGAASPDVTYRPVSNGAGGDLFGGNSILLLALLAGGAFLALKKG